MNIFIRLLSAGPTAVVWQGCQIDGSKLSGLDLLTLVCSLIVNCPSSATASRPATKVKMASAKINSALLEIAQRDDKAAAYISLLSEIEAAGSSPIEASDWNLIANGIFNDALGIVGTRNALTAFIQPLAAQTNNDTKTEAGQHVLKLLEVQTSTFEEQNMLIREMIADAYESEDDHLAAANILAGIPLDTSQRKVSPEIKAKLWIRITRNYLEVDDTTSAETYLNKFKNVIHQIDDQELLILFQLSQARVQDARRDFLAASKGYQDISLAAGQISEEERLHTLSMAIKCAVLAPAGPARSRALKNLYRDERSSTLEEFGILEKVFFDRLIAPAEVENFAEGLQAHQLARTSDGSTVLAKAMGEHNLLGASRLYSNIGFDQLGTLLGVDGEKAEETTARMIEQGRLVGRIDQIERIIHFEGGEATGEKGSGRTESAVGRELKKWDANVQALAEEVEQITSMLQMKYPVSDINPSFSDYANINIELCCRESRRLKIRRHDVDLPSVIVPYQMLPPPWIT
jgi:COP9 signalosome complex subunit 4